MFTFVYTTYVYEGLNTNSAATTDFQVLFPTPSSIGEKTRLRECVIRHGPSWRLEFRRTVGFDLNNPLIASFSRGSAPGSSALTVRGENRHLGHTTPRFSPHPS